MRYLNALNKISGVGPQKMKILFNCFKSPQEVWEAGLEELKKSQMGDKLAEKIVEERRNINPDAEWKKLERENIKIITLADSEYPALLKETHNPPYILYVKGQPDFNSSPLVAIVGARICSPYGAQAAQTIAKNLAQAGITVVSGMALGIDSFAHRGALDGGGKTIAVLGDSLDEKNIYPANNLNLSKEIAQNGALVSDYPIETIAGKLTFPARNRIVAGMSLGTIVIEAGERSGALITAQLALEYNREVFSVPGSIFSEQSRGTNRLIKSGAKIVTGIADILEELNLQENEIKHKIIAKNPDTPEEKKILDILSGEPLHIDNIAKLAKLQTAAVSSALSLMEIKGWTKNIGGQNYIIL